jgi:HSP20 family protein
MNALTFWNPLKEMEEFQRHITSFFDRPNLKPNPFRKEDETMTATDWMPQVDIVEDEKEYLIKADLPEVKKDDVKVTVENGVLMIAGERKSEKEEKNKKFHRMECSYGSFARSFALPDDADAAKIHAEFKEGALKVHVAKSEQARPKQIAVKVN